MEAPRHLQVGEIEMRADMGARRDIDDPRRRRRCEAIQQEPRQHVIAHVIEREGELEPVRRLVALGEDAASVVHQYVDARQRGEFLGKLAHAGEERQVGEDERHVALRPRRLDARDGGLAPHPVAADQHQPRALGREFLGGGEADARGRAGDHAGLAVERSHVRAPAPRAR